MTIYYRITDGALRNLTTQEYASLQANGKASTLRVYVVDPQPIAASSQVVNDGGVVVGPVEAHKTWILRNKTAEELAADQAETQRTADRSLILSTIDALRTGEGTAAERAQRVERVCVYVLRHLLR